MAVILSSKWGYIAPGFLLYANKKAIEFLKISCYIRTPIHGNEAISAPISEINSEQIYDWSAGYLPVQRPNPTSLCAKLRNRQRNLEVFQNALEHIFHATDTTAGVTTTPTILLKTGVASATRSSS
jgi:hypothetical protein